MTRPLVITDCDEVLMHMVVPFAQWVDEEHGVLFRMEDASFAGAVEGWRNRLAEFDASAAPVVPSPALWQRIIASTEAMARNAGLAKKYPCISDTPASRSASRSPCVSTPSPMTKMSISWHILTRLRTMLRRARWVSRLRTRPMSSLTRSG